MTAFATSRHELYPRRSVRATVRHAALDTLSLLPRRAAPGVRVLYYHHVFRDEAAAFERQLEHLARRFEPVSLSEAVERLATGRFGGRELAITFDDGFRSCLTHAAPILARHGFRACFFLVTDLVSARPGDAARLCRDRLQLRHPVEPLTWREAERLLELGHELGSHTRTHPNLAGLGPAQLADELEGSRARLREELGVEVAHFSAPFGDAARFPAELPAAARAAGYESCSSALRGRNTRASDVYALRRHAVMAHWPLAHVTTFLERRRAAS